MKTILQNPGLFARQKTSYLRSRAISVNYIAMFLMLTFLFSACHDKTKGQTSEHHKHAMSANDSLNKPKVNIKVNRRYDDKGNLVGFDSTYSSYYSNVKGDTARMDTLMHSFDRYFKNSHASFFNDEFKPLFFEDSIRYPDFFHDDFFMKRYELNDQYMRNMMHQMDSIKNKFYHDAQKQSQQHPKQHS